MIYKKRIVLLILLFLFGLANFGFSAKLYLEPSSGNLVSDCEHNIKIMIDTQGKQIIGAEIAMIFDYNIIIKSFSPSGVFNMPEVHRKFGGRYLHGYQASMEKLSGNFEYGNITIFPTKLGKHEINFDTKYSNNNIFDDYARNILSDTLGGKYNIITGTCKNIKTNSINHLSADFDPVENREKYIKNVEDQYFKKNNYYGLFVIIGIIVILTIIILFYKKEKK